MASLGKPISQTTVRTEKKKIPEQTNATNTRNTAPAGSAANPFNASNYSTATKQIQPITQPSAPSLGKAPTPKINLKQVTPDVFAGITAGMKQAIPSLPAAMTPPSTPEQGILGKIGQLLSGQTPQEQATLQAMKEGLSAQPQQPWYANPPTADDLMMALPIPSGMGKLGAEVNAVRQGSRALGTNPRNLAKLSPEIIAQIKKLTGVTEKLAGEGKILMQEGGEKILASMGKSTAGTATEAAMNSKVKELIGGAIKKWGGKIFVGSLGLSTLYKYATNQKSAQNDLTSHLDESAKTQTALRNTGNPEDLAFADTLAKADDQLGQDLAKWTSAFPILGKGNQKIQEAERQVNAHNNRMAANKITAEKTALQNQLDRDAEKSEADRKVLTSMVGKTDEEVVSNSEIAEAANDNALIQRRYMEALQNIKSKRDEEEQRIYDEIQKEMDRRYSERQKAEQRAYSEVLAAIQAQGEGGGSALNFGGGQW